MADLDDFFAKKDKKKKTKKGFSKANTEVLAKNLEENDRKEQQAEDKATDVVSRGPRFIENQQGLGNEADGDEWKEYEDTKLDYTNLKIDSLKIEDEADGVEDDDDVNEDGEKVKKSKEGGPWSKLVASDSVDKPGEHEEQDDKEEPPAATTVPDAAAAPATKSSYVPPHLRNSANSSANTGPVTSSAKRGRPKYAPDINSEVYFPSLSAAMGTDDPNRGQDQGSSNRGFEEVKSGGNQSSYNSRAAEAPKLALDNKFAALRD